MMASLGVLLDVVMVRRQRPRALPDGVVVVEVEDARLSAEGVGPLRRRPTRQLASAVHHSNQCPSTYMIYMLKICKHGLC